MADSADAERARLERRYERERKIRRDAEAIAEESTRRLFELTEALARSKAELERMNAWQRDFIAIASHELQTPITPIAGFAETLLERWDELLDEQRRTYVEAIGRQAKRLAQLASTLLTASRLEAGRVPVNPEVIELRACIDQVVRGLDTDAVVSTECPHGLAIEADREHLRQILTNYLTNALKYGRAPVSVEASVDGGWVELRVRDAGEGVPPDFVPRLFEKFARADLLRNPGGTGLGLYIVRGLARAAGGDAWYEPSPSGGACFAVKLPRG